MLSISFPTLRLVSWTQSVWWEGDIVKWKQKSKVGDSTCCAMFFWISTESGIIYFYHCLCAVSLCSASYVFPVFHLFLFKLCCEALLESDAFIPRFDDDKVSVPSLFCNSQLFKKYSSLSINSNSLIFYTGNVFSPPIKKCLGIATRIKLRVH